MFLFIHPSYSIQVLVVSYWFISFEGCSVPVPEFFWGYIELQRSHFQRYCFGDTGELLAEINIRSVFLRTRILAFWFCFFIVGCDLLILCTCVWLIDIGVYNIQLCTQRWSFLGWRWLWYFWSLLRWILRTNLAKVNDFTFWLERELKMWSFFLPQAQSKLMLFSLSLFSLSCFFGGPLSLRF